MFALSFGGRKNLAAIGACAGALTVSAGAEAGMTIIPLGSSGWQAEFDDTLNPLLDINFLATIGDNVFIQKSAEFTSMAPISVTFRQIAANAVSNIVIDDEIITNSTGFTWPAFTMDVLGNPNVAFDPVATAASGGFSVNPFTTSAFSNGNTRFTASGGPGIPPDGIWFPGLNSGQLFIHSTGGTVGSTFTLVETPVPAPGALALLGLAGAVGARRRRR